MLYLKCTQHETLASAAMKDDAIDKTDNDDLGYTPLHLKAHTP